MEKYNCILLVDDDDTSNFITQKVINQLKIASRTHCLKNGKEALVFIKEQCEGVILQQDNLCPDLIFLDINMPVMNGLEFLEAFYGGDKFSGNCFKNVNIYVLTSSENVSDKETVSHYKIKGYINKPLTTEKLIELRLA